VSKLLSKLVAKGQIKPNRAPRGGCGKSSSGQQGKPAVSDLMHIGGTAR
jgi:hypothetical protein